MAETEQELGFEAEPPHSIVQASIDDKGRLKLPSEFLQYLKAAGVTRVFVTTMDFRQVRIYPLSLWKRNESVFENAGENTKAAERLAWLAKSYGGDAEIDASGRVLLPAPLRDKMGLEKQPVFVDHYNGRINAVTKQVRDELLQVSIASAAEDLKTVEKLGFK